MQINIYASKIYVGHVWCNLRYYPALLNFGHRASTISRSGRAYSASGPQLRSLKGDHAGITRKFAIDEANSARRMAGDCGGSKYDLRLHLQLVGPSYSPARRPPKKSLGWTRTERREGRRGGITGGSDCRLVYSVLDAPSCGLRRRWCPATGPTPVQVPRMSFGISSGRRNYPLGQKY